jgi:hypothetical protein
MYRFTNRHLTVEDGCISASWILLAITLVLTLFVFRSQDLWVYYEHEIKSEKKKRQRRSLLALLRGNSSGAFLVDGPHFTYG